MAAVEEPVLLVGGGWVEGTAKAPPGGRIAPGCFVPETSEYMRATTASSQCLGCQTVVGR